MVWFLILMLYAVPAAILLLAFVWLFREDGDGENLRLWLVMLLLLDLMLLPMAYYSLWGLFSQTLFTFLEIPFVIGLLAVMLINWRKYVFVWETHRLVLVVLSLTACILLALMAWGGGVAMLVIPLYALVIAGLWLLISRLGGVLINLLILVTLALLFLEATGSLNSRMITASNWRGATSIFGSIGLLMAFILLMLLVQRMLSMETRLDQRSSWIHLGLIMLLLLGIGAVDMRHGILANATGRAYEDLLPALSFLLALVVGLILIISLPGWGKFVGAAFLIVGMAWILAAYSLGWAIDPQQITQARANRINQAIESYHEHNGSFPDSLNELEPRYLPILLGPLTGHDQVWCYQSGSDFYRLGYVWYQRYYGPSFPTPHMEIKIFSSSGQPPDQPWVCDQELQRFKQTIGF
jgi:hypothetical protein